MKVQKLIPPPAFTTLLNCTFSDFNPLLLSTIYFEIGSCEYVQTSFYIFMMLKLLPLKMDSLSAGKKLSFASVFLGLGFKNAVYIYETDLNT